LVSALGLAEVRSLCGGRQGLQRPYLKISKKAFDLRTFCNPSFLLFFQAETAKERLPVYHETGSKKIYEAQLAANDWTGITHGDRKLR
jgi:hypothetical protein